MKPIINSIIVFLLALFIALPTRAQTQKSVGALQTGTEKESAQINKQTLEKYLDGLVEYAMKTHHLPGVVVSIVHNDSLVLAKGWGHASVKTDTPVDPEQTLFRVASISKTFTFTGIMQLVENGQLRLDEDISTYLKDVQVKGSETYGPITMEHLMTHSAGFEETYLGHFNADSPETDYERTFYLNRYQPERVRPPGEVISYSNYGVDLAGQVLEDISGESFSDYMDQHVLHRIGMMQSSFRDGPHLNPELAKARARGYQWSSGRQIPSFKNQYGHRGGYASGSLSATATDMAKFMRAHLNNGLVDGMRILQPETIEKMHGALMSNGEDIPGNAHGFWTGNVSGYETIGHSGSIFGFRSNVILVPELDLGIFVATNSSAGVPFIFNFPQMLINDIVSSKSNIPAPDSSLVKRADIYAGTYLGTRRGYTTIDKMVQLRNGATNVSVTQSGYLAINGRRYAPAGDHRFVEVISGDAISFDVKDGRASRILTTYQAFDRIGYWQTSQAFYVVVLISFIVFIGTLVGFWKRRSRSIEQTPGEKWASYGIGITALLWLFSVSTLIYVLITTRESEVLVHFPNLLAGIALWGTLVSATLTIISLLGLIPVWRHRSWGIPRSMRYTITVAVMAGLTLMLWQWNAIGVQVTGG